MAEVTFVGTGEAFDPDLPNVSLLYRGGCTLLVDCGFSVPHALWRLSRDPSLLDGIYLSHRHADHCFGLPALLLWMREEGRTRPLQVIGGAGFTDFLPSLLDFAYPGAWSDGFAIEPMELLPGARHALGGCQLSTAPSRHSVENLALRIDEGRASCCYSGDGSPSDATRQLFRGASLLAHECFYATRDSQSHAGVESVLALAADAGVDTLALLHLGRHEKAAIQRHVATLAGGPKVVIPTVGATLPLP